MRILAVSCAAFSAAVFAANYLLDIGMLPAFAAAFLAAGLAAALLRRKIPAQIAAVLIFASVGFGTYMLHYSLTVERAQSLEGESRIISVLAVDCPKQYDTYTSLDAVLWETGVPRLDITVYSEDGFLDNVRPGDIIRLSANLFSADERYGRKTDKYISRDIYLTATANGPALKTGEHRASMRVIASEIREAISNRADEVFGPRTAPFMKSLMVGDRSDFYNNDRLYTAMSRSGLMHIVAVSGMHVSYIVTFIQLILGKGRKSSIICLVIVWIFVAVSGASPSAVRAGFMLSLFLAAPLLKRESDGITSLMLALAVILAQNPFSAKSVSLQLSFAAMAGLTFVSDRMNTSIVSSISDPRLKKLLRKPTAVFSGSIGVMIFSLPLMAVNFGYVSLLSPLSNILCVWAVPYCFGGGFLSCALWKVPILGKISVLAVRLLANVIFLSASLTSAADFAVVYTSSRAMGAWLGAVYLIIIPMCFVRRSPVKKTAITVAASALLLFGVKTAVRVHYNTLDGVYTAVDVGQGQCITAFSGDKTVMIDCGNSSAGFDNAGESAAAYLRNRGRAKIDVLFVTHLHADHANGIKRLSELYDIDRIVLTSGADNSDELVEEIIKAAFDHGTVVEYITEDENVNIGQISISLYAPPDSGTKNERCMMLRLSCKGVDMLITADAAMTAERSLIEREELEGTEILIVGHHGSKYSTSEELLEELDGELAIISVGDNSYGHPAEEVLARLAGYGYSVRRTDKNGNVEVRIK